MQPTATALLDRLLARGEFRHVQVLLHLAELGILQPQGEGPAAAARFGEFVRSAAARASPEQA